MFLLLLLPFELPLPLPCNSRTPIKPSSAICIISLDTSDSLSRKPALVTRVRDLVRLKVLVSLFFVSVFLGFMVLLSGSGAVFWNVATWIMFWQEFDSFFCFWLTCDSDFCGFVWSLKEFLKPFLRSVNLLIQSYPSFFFMLHPVCMYHFSLYYIKICCFSEI